MQATLPDRCAFKQTAFALLLTMWPELASVHDENANEEGRFLYMKVTKPPRVGSTLYRLQYVTSS